MGWIISTCILGARLLFVLFLDDYVAITDLRKEIASKNRLIGQKEEIERLQDGKIARQEVKIALLRERAQEQRQLIDRLSNMNALQPVMEQPNVGYSYNHEG